MEREDGSIEEGTPHSGKALEGVDDRTSERYTVRHRRARILELVQQHGFVTVVELAEMFDMTVQSVRRDLNTLADKGLVLRKRGGVSRIPTAERDSSDGILDDGGLNSDRFTIDSRVNRALKRRIAAAAAAHLRPGNVVFLYSGSTVALVPAAIPAELRPMLTVVTNSLPVINEVGSWADPNLIAVGGLFLQTHMAFVGPQTDAAYRRMGADVALIGASGLSAEFGLTTPNDLIAEVGGTIVERARRTIVVADSSKIGGVGVTPIAPLGSVDLLITDAGADPAELDALRAAGMEVQIA